MNANKAAIDRYIVISDEVKEAQLAGQGIVALESTILSHGMPYPHNVETAFAVEQIIRESGAVPATIALINGMIRIGLKPEEIEQLGHVQNKKDVLKVSWKDLPYALAMKKLGSTTVAATMSCAELAQIPIFVTGGIGGVHRHGETTLDISNDLQALAQKNVAVICAGAKSILDIGRTLEVLETLGVPVIGYKTNYFPEFYCRGQKHLVDYRLDHFEEIVHLLKLKWALNLKGGVLIGNSIPEQEELDCQWMEQLLEEALQEAESQGIKGKFVTPFLLSALAKKTGGKSLKANIALIKHNAKLGAELAKSYAHDEMEILHESMR